MNALEKELLAIEEEFWSGDEAYYHEHADASCLVAFAEMAGLMDNPDLAATAGEGNRWRNVGMDVKGIVRPRDDIAILTYEANAERADGQPHHALVSTGYVRREGGWKMMFHSQTALPDKQVS